MQNNQVKALEVAIPDRKPTFKDKSASTHITLDFGTVVPGHFERIYQDTEFSVGDRERCILTSLVAPCFGDLSLKSFSYFVPFSALTRNYSAMMAQQAVSRGGNTAPFVPLAMPSVEMRQLSLAVLIGAQMSVYTYDRVTRRFNLYALPGAQPVNDAFSNLPSVMQAIISNLGLQNTFSAYGLSNAWSIDLARILGMGTVTSSIPLGNLYPSTFFDARVNHPDDTIPNIDPVGLGEGQYDYVVPVTVQDSSSNDVDYILAFRLSSFGRRLRKILIGLGWQFSLTSIKPFSVLRLVAWYCAYFELFQPKRYKNWEQTYAFDICQRSDLAPSPTWQPFASASLLSSSAIFRSFIVEELGSCFYTDPMDFVSAHNTTATVAPSMQSGVNSSLQVDVISQGNLIDPDTSSQSPVVSQDSGHARITTIVHGALDEKVLMRLYRTTNVCTPAGRRIDELCRAQGLGPDMEKVKAKFIGSWELDLDIYDLPAQSDTYNKVSEDGKQLGEFGAYGKSTGKHEKVHYKTSEDGYFINLICVVPKGGYCETVDPSATRLGKYGQYNPIFDSLGYQFNTKDETIIGSITWQQTGYEDPTGTTDGELTDSFGLAPVCFEKKFGRNVINGDFSLNSQRNKYASWNLEKLLSANDHRIQNVQRDPSGNEYGYVFRMSKPADLPVAGDVWRYTARYEWLSRFNRIFYNSFSTFSGMVGIADSVRTAMYELFSLRDDNFILHMRFDIAVYDRMLPVQQSFETEDEELKANSKMSKA